MKSPVLYGPWPQGTSPSIVDEYLSVFTVPWISTTHQIAARALVGRPGWCLGWNQDDGTVEWLLDPPADRDRCLSIAASTTHADILDIYRPDYALDGSGSDELLHLPARDLTAWLDMHESSYNNERGWHRGLPFRVVHAATQQRPEAVTANRAPAVTWSAADQNGRGVLCTQVGGHRDVVTFGRRHVAASRTWGGKPELALRSAGDDEQACDVLSRVAAAAAEVSTSEALVTWYDADGQARQAALAPDRALHGTATPFGTAQITRVTLLD